MRNSVDSVFNSQGQQLMDLCIASQLRVLNGRFIGDMLGNMTCYKPNGTSTVDYANLLGRYSKHKTFHFLKTIEKFLKLYTKFNE
jgi:ribosomal protein S2